MRGHGGEGLPEPAAPGAEAEAVCELLRRRRWTLALAESCTGGAVATALAAVPGASRVLWGSAVAYTVEAKVKLLGLAPDLLRRHGAVSAATAAAMATAVRELAGASLGLAVTGWAGPEGGTARDPVGTIYLALDDGAEVATRRLRLAGDRQAVRRAAAAAALACVRRRLQRRD